MLTAVAAAIGSFIPRPGDATFGFHLRPASKAQARRGHGGAQPAACPMAQNGTAIVGLLDILKLL